MIISLNWIKKFVEIDMPIDELSTLIGARLVEIEEVIDIGAKYKNIPVVKVVKCNNLEGSDHLSVVMIDDGGKILDVERDANGLVQVVCGAPNISVGQMVVWLPPNVIVPSTYYSSEPFKLSSRILQGVKSNGMIASAKELDLFDEHTGILVVDKDISPGTIFAESYELNDYLLDIENKSLTHRPDCFGIVGFAREIAAITGKDFKTPDWLMNINPDFKNDDGVKLSINVDITNPELSDRYQAIVVSGADSKKQSPLQIQTYLARVGLRPINAVVDVTNYLMMLTGQPLHAFDYDKLVSVAGGDTTIHVRNGKNDEKLQLLDNKIIELSSEDIVIATDEKAIALAGAMGGLDTAIDESTINIVIESATFNLYNLRSTQMRHGIFSEAITRFTKGQPAGLTAPVLYEATKLMAEWSGAKVVSELAESYPGKRDIVKVELSNQQINNILGSEFKNQDILEIMQRAEFHVEEKDNNLVLAIPYWRQDMYIKEDFAEEMGRLNGFDNIKPTLPSRDFTATKPSNYDILRTKIRKILVRAGASEVLTYSFVHGDVIKKACQKVENSYRVVNSISPNLQYYRQSLTPNLLDLVHPNIKNGFDNFALFEINKSHSKINGLDNESVPLELDMTALVVSNKNEVTGSPYYQAKYMLDYLCSSFGLKIKYEAVDKQSYNPVLAPFEQKRSAKVIDKNSGNLIGVVGEYKQSVIRSFKLSKYSAGFEIDTLAFFDSVMKSGKIYKPISKYPSSDRDICFNVRSEIAYSKVVDSLERGLGSCKLDFDITPVDIYQSANEDVKNITIKVKLTAIDHTLTGDEVADVINNATLFVSNEIDATVI
ncbi:MAG: phenylalanine--tRNA ligase subunit beta [Candidatus Saccharibacteria bacterium]